MIPSYQPSTKDEKYSFTEASENKKFVPANSGCAFRDPMVRINALSFSLFLKSMSDLKTKIKFTH